MTPFLHKLVNFKKNYLPADKKNTILQLDKLDWKDERETHKLIAMISPGILNIYYEINLDLLEIYLVNSESTGNIRRCNSC